jgi:hypothetical protein
MLKAFRSALSLVNPFASHSPPETDPVTRFANSGWSQATTPDEIIVAHILGSFGKKFEDWEATRTDYRETPTPLPYLPELVKLERKRKEQGGYDPRTFRFRFRNTKTNMVIKGHYVIKHGNKSYQPHSIDFEGLDINEIPMTPHLGETLVRAYLDIRKAGEDAKRVADKATIEMQINEKKWNLAERLLNMTRNEQGALVPVVVVSDGPDGVAHAPAVGPEAAPRRRKKKADSSVTVIESWENFRQAEERFCQTSESFADRFGDAVDSPPDR